MSNNKKLAEIFYQMSEILEIKNQVWESRAYQKAARTLESLSKDVDEIYKAGGTNALMKIPGIGKALAEKIEQFLTTGKIKKYEEVLKSIPPGLIDMINVPGMGPKKVSKLYNILKIDSIEKLEKAAKEGKIRSLEGFGEKSEKDILVGIDLVKRGRERMPLWKALPLSREIVEYLKKNCRSIQKIEVAGSIRRRKETIGDIDILVISDKPDEVMSVFTKMPNVFRVENKGETKSSVNLEEGLDCDVRVLKHESFGAALNYFTGSKEHNIHLRQIAITKNWKLSEYGLFDKSGKQIAGKTEDELYKRLGMPYIEPEMRENTGEIEISKNSHLPRLISYNSIKGDLHVHTKFSDGLYSPEEMIKKAIELKYEYVAITDHSKAERVANGMDEKRVLEYIKYLEKMENKFPQIHILKGSEVSILKDGRLDFSKQALEKLDFVVASVHSGFKILEQDMTKRVLTALESGFVDVLGHPTGKIVNQRNPFEINLEKIFEKAKDLNVSMEIDSNERFDLNDFNIKKAKAFGLKFSISTDAHSTDHMSFMEFGIAQARRGWLEEKDVINTLPWKQFENLIKR